jgi:hypothetical protein
VARSRTASSACPTATSEEAFRSETQGIKSFDGDRALASALSDLWAGRLVDRDSCGALSTGVTAGPRVLQSPVAGADRIAALDLVPCRGPAHHVRPALGHLISADCPWINVSRIYQDCPARERT